MSVWARVAAWLAGSRPTLASPCPHRADPYTYLTAALPGRGYSRIGAAWGADVWQDETGIRVTVARDGQRARVTCTAWFPVGIEVAVAAEEAHKFIESL